MRKGARNMRKNVTFALLVCGACLAACCAVFLAGCGSLHKFDYTEVEQDTKSKLATASVLSNDELYQRAKEEMANTQMNVYSSTSLADVALENFTSQYPALAGKVVFHDLDDESTYPQLVQEIEQGSKNVDLLLSHSDLVSELTGTNAAYNYFPISCKGKVNTEYQMPTAFMYSSSLFMYNKANGSIDLDNIWALTEPEWQGRILMKNPTTEQVNMDFLSMLTSSQWTKNLEEAYFDYYGQAWAQGEYDTIAHQWTAEFLTNCDFSIAENSEIVKELVNSNEQKIALVTYNKLRKLSSEERENIGIFALEKDMNGFGGFAFGTYATVISQSNCPYTCALFINYILSEQGFSGEGTWNTYCGYYSTNNMIEKSALANDYNFDYWEDKLVIEDFDYLKNKTVEIRQFVQECMSGL